MFQTIVILTLFLISNCPLFSQWESFLVSSCVFDMIILERIAYLLSGTSCPEFTLYIFCARPAMSHFSKQFWFLLCGMAYRDNSLDIRSIHCHRAIISSRPFQWTTLIKTFFLMCKPYIINLESYFHSDQ